MFFKEGFSLALYSHTPPPPSWERKVVVAEMLVIYRVMKKKYPPKILNNSAEIDATSMDPWPVEKTAFKR